MTEATVVPVSVTVAAEAAITHTKSGDDDDGYRPAQLDTQSMITFLPASIRAFVDVPLTTHLASDRNYFLYAGAIEHVRFLEKNIQDALVNDISHASPDSGLSEFIAWPGARTAQNCVAYRTFLSQTLMPQLEAKLNAIVDAAASRAEAAFVPLFVRYTQRIGFTTNELRVFKYVLARRVLSFDEERYYSYQDERSNVSVRDLECLFPDISLSEILSMLRSSSTFVQERWFNSVSTPHEKVTFASEAMVNAIEGVPLTVTQYHAIASTVMKECLAADPAFQNSEAGRAHTAANNLRAGSDDGSAANFGEQPVSGAGAKLRSALQERDQKKKESVFDVLQSCVAGADSAEANDELVVSLSRRGTEDFVGADKELGAADDPDDVATFGADAEHDKPYKGDLAYLEDQFRLMHKEVALHRLKRKLDDVDEEDADEGDDDDIGYRRYGGRRRGMGATEKTNLTLQLNAQLRKQQVQVKVLVAMIRSRLVSTSQASKWFPRLEILSEALNFSKFEKSVVLHLLHAVVAGPVSEFGQRGDSSIRALLKKFSSTMEESIRYRSAFYKSGPLVKEGIVTIEGAEFGSDLSSASVAIDRRMLDFLIGLDTEFSEMIDGSHLYTPSVPLEDVVLPDADKARVVNMVRSFEQVKLARAQFDVEEKFGYGCGQVVMFYGASGTGKTMLANAIAGAMKKKVLLINFPSLGTNSAGAIIKILFREAKINKALLFFDECEALFMSRDKGQYAVNTVLTELERFDGICILATNRPCDIDDAMYRRINLAVEFRKPDHLMREAIWKTLHPPKLPLAADVNFTELALKFELTGGFIKNSWLSALSFMVQREGTCVCQDDLMKAASEQLIGRLSMEDFDRKVTPTCGLDALVCTPLVKESLQAIVDHTKAQAVLVGQWGFGKQHRAHRGAAALFCGCPGTGKTMAAEAIGFDIGKPLKVVNVAELVSKWVGETGKNLQSVFDHAVKVDAVLVFDEAEGLFAKRSSGSCESSRHDNMNVGLLLQLIESFSGICIVITNMKELVDPAFFRRFRFVLEFERPARHLRRKIWANSIPKELPLSADVDLDTIAEKFDLTGGEIKSVVLRTATRAALRPEASRHVAMKDLLDGCAEEVKKQTDAHQNNDAVRSMFL